MVWDFKGEKDNSQGDGKSKRLVNEHLPCQSEKSSLHKTKLSWVMALLLVQGPYLNSFFNFFVIEV